MLLRQAKADSMGKVILILLFMSSLYSADFGQIESQKEKLIKAMDDKRTKLENKIDALSKKLKEATSINNKITKDLKLAVNSFQIALNAHKRCQKNYDSSIKTLRSIAEKGKWSEASFIANTKRYENDYQTCLKSNSDFGALAKNLQTLIEKAKNQINADGMNDELVKHELDTCKEELTAFTNDYEKLFGKGK